MMNNSFTATPPARALIPFLSFKEHSYTQKTPVQMKRLQYLLTKIFNTQFSSAFKQSSALRITTGHGPENM